MISAGLSFQWIRFNGAPSYRKTSYSLAFGGNTVSLGATYNSFSSADDAAVDRLGTFDVGLMLRPFSVLSFGLAVKDLDGSRLRGATLPRRYDAGLAFRPFTDRLSFAADLIADDVSANGGARLSYTALLEPLEGFVISAGYSHVLSGAAQSVGQIALTLNGRHFGATYAGALSREIAGADHLLQLRLSRGVTRSVAAPHHRYVVLDLKELLAAKRAPLISLLPGEARDPYLTTLAALRRLAIDPRVDGVVLKVSDLDDVGNGKVEELRQAILTVRASGKRVIAYLTDGGDNEYYLASAAEKLFCVPEATLLINGYSASALFLGETLEKIGVSVDVAKVGAFKNAPDEFVRRDMSAEQREATTAFLDGVDRRYVEGVTRARGLTEAQLRAVLSQGLLTPKMAKAAGLVDDVLYPDELQEWLNKSTGRQLDLSSEYEEEEPLTRSWGQRGRLALINITGTIADGKSRADPFGAVHIAGAETILKQLEDAGEDPLVRAVVLRVDSGGGSASASDMIWRSVRRLREHKTVVVSMGDYAASGGYYIAMAGEEILAEPNTLTGSIGVFALKPNFGGLLAKLGVHQEVIRKSERADLFSFMRPWTEGEQQAVQRYVDEFYDTFITKVAAARKLDKARVDGMARGRIWSGTTAKELGLVDAIGGLPEAIVRARSLAKVPVDEELDIELYGASRGLPGLSVTPGVPGLPARVQQALGVASDALGGPLADLPEGPLMMVPYRLVVK